MFQLKLFKPPTIFLYLELIAGEKLKASIAAFSYSGLFLSDSDIIFTGVLNVGACKEGNRAKRLERQRSRFQSGGGRQAVTVEGNGGRRMIDDVLNSPQLVSEQILLLPPL